MGMLLPGTSHSAIKRAALDSGLMLTAGQALDIANAEKSCLAESNRVSFGGSAAEKIVRGFATSPFVPKDEAASVLVGLTEAFYELRDDYPASVTDAEIIESLKLLFDDEAAGDVETAAALAREALSSRQGFSTYEIADEGGKVYRWDPGEWHDDVRADGWYGERWEDVDE